MYGLGQYETGVLRTLPAGIRRIVLEEVADGDPESLADMAELLRARDPARTVAREYAREMAEAVGEAVASPAGLEAGLGKSLKKKFKKAAKRARKVVKKVARKAAPILAVVAPYTLAIKSIRKGAAKFYRKNLPIIVTVAGAVAAPFTGGASMAVASAIVAGHGLYKQRKAAMEAKRLAKKEAGEMEAQVAAQEADLGRQMDELYARHQEHFMAAGIDPQAWSGMSVEDKLAVIDRINRGEMPADPEVESAAAAGRTAPEVYQEVADPGPAGSVEESPRTVEEAAAPAGRYDLVVEGEKVADATDIGRITKAVIEKTSTWDRFEVLLDGRSTGLKVRTPGGAVSIPPEEADKVIAMTRDQIKAVFSKAAEKAAAMTGAPKPEGKGVPWWLVAAPVAVAVL